MSDLLRLRDHSQPCEHGYFEWHYDARTTIETFDPCSGGREVVLQPHVCIAQCGDCVRKSVYVEVTDHE